MACQEVLDPNAIRRAANTSYAAPTEGATDAEAMFPSTGFREHIFTENVSSLASYMALQENLFTTTNQRLYFTPLRVGAILRGAMMGCCYFLSGQ